MRSRSARRIVVILLLAAGAAVVRFTVLRPKPVPVTVFAIAPGIVEETVTNSKAGTVKSRRRSSLSPEMGGRVVELPVKKGDRVTEGQVLVRLAAGDVEAEVALRERTLEAARESERQVCQSADQAERERARMARLVKDHIVSADLFEKAESEARIAVSACAAARAHVREAEAAGDVARATLGKSVLRAPFPGVVAELQAHLGEWITPSPPGIAMPSVVELIDPDASYVSAPLDEVDAGKVHAGLPVRVSMDAYPGRSFPGKVVRVAPYVVDRELQSRTFEIEVDFDDAVFARTLLPGASADVEVILAAKDGVLRVPSYALLEGGKALVFKDGKLAAAKVETGLRNWEFAEVTAGLAAGDKVVTSLDREEVKEGAKAAIAGETTR
ncbi:MAG: efflux RND transporter periplasmic adaptor subunit [Acidobacteriota bacterium]